MTGALIVKVILVAGLIIEALGRIALIGQARKTYTNGEAIFGVIWAAGLIWLILAYL